MLGFTVSPEELKVFIDEAEELLARMESHVFELEKKSDENSIHELFRVAHTIKGGAASVGYESMAKLSHHLESLLDGIRRHTVEITPGVIEILLQSLDALRTFNKNLREGKASPVNLELQTAIAAYAKREAPPSFSKQNGYEIHVEISPDCDMPAVRAFQVLSELKKFGDVGDSAPSASEIEKGEADARKLTVRFEAKADVLAVKRELEKISDIVGVHLKPVQSKSAPIPSSGNFSEELKSARTMRVDIGLFDNLMNLAGELVIGKTRLMNVVGDLQKWGEAGFLGEAILNTAQQLSKITAELQAEVMKARLVPVSTLTSKFPRAIRDLAKRAGKEVECVIEGAETQLDRSVLEVMIDPMIHLLRNAVDHGIESPQERKRAGKPPRGTIKISARQEENHVALTVADDGRGVQSEKVKDKAVRLGFIEPAKAAELGESDILNFLFSPGFSTADKVTEISGRGVGLDVVKSEVQKIGGTIEIKTEAGKGTRFTFFIPLTLAILSGLKVKVNRHTFIIPLNSVHEIVKLKSSEFKTIGGKAVMILRDSIVPLFGLGELFGEAAAELKEWRRVVVISSGDKRMGILVDQSMGNDDVVIKAIDSYVGAPPAIAGATVLGDGTVSLIFDIPSLFQFATKKIEAAA